MPKYRVSGLLTVSVSTCVEADTEAEAKELAMANPNVGLCHQCAGGDEDSEWVTSGELDGEPTELRAEVE